jgi:hypothetical protein
VVDQATVAVSDLLGEMEVKKRSDKEKRENTEGRG